MYYLGVDTGGTFTDFVLFEDEKSEIATFKLRSQPNEPWAPIAAGLRRIEREWGISADRIERFIYGTTVATNAVLEQKGAAVALFTTRGIRDVLEIQRQWRQRLFDLYLEKPAPLVPRRRRFEVAERVSAQGETLEPLGEAEIERCLACLDGLPVEAVAVVFLFSFLRPEHERRLAAAIRAARPELKVTVSCDISPEFREYERSATTVMNAYTMPKLDAVVDRTEAILAEAGFAGAFGIIQSNGGVMGPEKARAAPVNTLLSGPAGGVVGAAAVARLAGIDNILTMDIGGTSTDIALVEGAEVRLVAEGGIAGYPVRVPQVAVHTIGAGGGSIAKPLLGVLKVGPESAGADPGPACYGQGGAEPTSTDAALCAGFLDPDYFLGGEMRLDRRAAERAIEEKVARHFGMPVAEAALAILRVQVSNIVSGIRKVSVEAGHDPRDFTLLPFGGAGGLYAGLIAEEMNIRRIFVPRHPSVLSALGMLMTDVRHSVSVTKVGALSELDAAEIAAAFARLAEAAGQEMTRDRIPAPQVSFEFSCDLRYVGQAYELNVRLDGRDGRPTLDLRDLAGAFHTEHLRLYGQSAESEPVELVALRVTATGAVPQARLRPLPQGRPGGPGFAPKGERKVLFPGSGWRQSPVYAREALPPGARLAGPAVVEDEGAALPRLPGHALAVDGFGNLSIEVGGAR